MKAPSIKIGSINLKPTCSYQTAFSLIWLFYSVFYVFCSACETAYKYNLSSYMKIVQLVTCALLLISVLFLPATTTKKIAMSVILIVLTVLITLSDVSLDFLIVIVFVIFGQFIDFKKFVQFDFKVKLVLLACVFLLCLVGIAPNNVGTYGTEEYGSTKMALGFSHPNRLGLYVYTVLVEWLYLRIKKMHFIEYIAICAVVVVLDMICRSRTTEFTFVAILILYGILRLREGIIYSKIVHFLLVIAVPLVMGCSYLFAYMYGDGNEAMAELDSAMSGRLHLSYRFLDYYNQTPFGQEINIWTRGGSGDSVGILDNAYVRIGLMYGVVFLILFCVAYMYAIHVCLKQRRAELALFCLFMVIIGFGESKVFAVFYNITLISLMACLDYKNTLSRFRRTVRKKDGCCSTPNRESSGAVPESN